MTVVKIELYDQQEMVWFTQFHAALMQYRDEQTRQMEAELDEQLEAEARVVGHIGAEPVEPELMGTGEAAEEQYPTLAELTAAVQASLVGDAMPAQVEKVKGLLARYGAKVLSEVPEDKRAELIEGLK